MSLKLIAPVPLSAKHQIDQFSCGAPSLDNWLADRSLANQVSGASRTFVVADASGRVYGYYAVAAGAVSHAVATGGVRRNMPEPIPVMILARLAVDQHARGQQLGGALLRDALLRATTVSQSIGVRALLVHALDEHAKSFYEHYGFQVSPIEPMTLMLRLTVTKIRCRRRGRAT
jgi:GNAT superfamily N-acetyltransferase